MAIGTTPYPRARSETTALKSRQILCSNPSRPFVIRDDPILLGARAGLDPQQIVDVVADGAGGSRMFQVRGPMMVAGDYRDATMKVEVWQKDMAIITDFARSLRCPTPLFLASAPLYTTALAAGRGGEDTASVCAVLEAMAGVKRGPARRTRRLRGDRPII